MCMPIGGVDLMPSRWYPCVMSYLKNKYSRFLAKVNIADPLSDECWPWVGATKGNGYGNFRLDGKNVTAHRAAHKLFIGDVPDGADVCHTCDNRYCVNPDHLFIGSRKDNMEDMSRKGRGAGSNRRKLKEAEVQEVRQRLTAGHSPRKIASHMGLNYGTVTAIRAGRSYAG